MRKRILTDQDRKVRLLVDRILKTGSAAKRRKLRQAVEEIHGPIGPKKK